MLYDHKRWDKTETKPDVFSLEGLIAWLEKQPADRTYSFLAYSGRCLIGIYGDAVGIRWVDFHSKLFDEGKLDVASGKPWTFGAALERARAAL